MHTISDEEQGTMPSHHSCKHNYPIVVTRTETGCYACCLKCLTEGPERPFSEAARLALVSGEGKKGSATALLPRRGSASS